MEEEKTTDILLVGKTGQGKSATGNSILQKLGFISNSQLTSVTDEANMDVSYFKNRLLKVVDSPGIGDTSYNKRVDALKFIEKISLAMAINVMGYHALLFIVRFGNRFTKEEVYAAELFKTTFGPDFIAKHGIIVMTGGDNFVTDPGVRKRNLKFEDWVSEQTDPNFTALLREVDNRIVLFDNITEDKSLRILQLRRLILMIDNLPINGKRYTSEIFRSIKQARDDFIRQMERPLLSDDLFLRICILREKFYKAFLESHDATKVLSILENIRDKAELFYLRIIEDDKGTGSLNAAKNLLTFLKEDLDNEIRELRESKDLSPETNSRSETSEKSSTDFVEEDGEMKPVAFKRGGITQKSVRDLAKSFEARTGMQQITRESKEVSPSAEAYPHIETSEKSSTDFVEEDCEMEPEDFERGITRKSVREIDKAYDPRLTTQQSVTLPRPSRVKGIKRSFSTPERSDGNQSPRICTDNNEVGEVNLCPDDLENPKEKCILTLNQDVVKEIESKFNLLRQDQTESPVRVSVLQFVRKSMRQSLK